MIIKLKISNDKQNPPPVPDDSWLSNSTNLCNNSEQSEINSIPYQLIDETIELKCQTEQCFLRIDEQWIALKPQTSLLANKRKIDINLESDLKREDQDYPFVTEFKNSEDLNKYFIAEEPSGPNSLAAIIQPETFTEELDPLRFLFTNYIPTTHYNLEDQLIEHESTLGDKNITVTSNEKG